VGKAVTSFSRAVMAREALKVGFLGPGEAPDRLRRSEASTFLSSTSFLKLALESALREFVPKASEPFDTFPGLPVNVKLRALGLPVVNDKVKPLFDDGLDVVDV
jgi:hypothetical protein